MTVRTVPKVRPGERIRRLQRLEHLRDLFLRRIRGVRHNVGAVAMRDLGPWSQGITNLVRAVCCVDRRGMRPLLQGRRLGPQPGPEHAQTVEAVEVTDRQAALLPPVAAGSRACCCSATPAFQVVLPPREGQPSATEILFCGHHCRQHHRRLRAHGAAIYDCTGWPVDLLE